MRKITTLLTTCCIAALTLSAAPTFACDEDKEVVKTAQTDGHCGAGKEAAAVAVSNDEAAKGECAVECSARHLMAALEKMDGCCGAKCPGRADLVVAVRSLASMKEGLVCEKKLAALTGETAVLSVKTGDASGCCAAGTAKTVSSKGSSCSGDAKAAKTATLASGKGSTCSGDAKAATLVSGKGSTCGGDAKAAKTATLASGKGSTCSGGAKDAKTATLVSGKGSTCSGDAKNAKAAKLAADGSGTCSSKGADARYVAFGCEKSDRIARAAAQAYLAIMSELKATNGAEGCPYSAASEVLATLLQEKRDEAQAAAAAGTAVADAK